MKKYTFLFPIICLLACQQKGSIDSLPQYRTWSSYLGDNARTHYSQLSQINTSNVGKLKVAWQYASGDIHEDNRSQIQCSPLVVDTILYGTNPALKLFAVHAATGKEIWKYPINSISDAFRLENGNTLITTTNQILAIDQTNPILWNKQGCSYGSMRK